MARLLRFFLSVCFFGILSAVLVMAAGVTAARAPGPLGQSILVVIEKGQGVRGVAGLLEEKGAIQHRYLFLLSVVLSGNGSRLQAGEYEILPHASARNIAVQMAQGRVYQRKLTIAEGLSVFEVMEIVKHAQGLTGDMPFLPPPEGSLLPETYAYTWGETRAGLISRMEKEMEKTLNHLWANRRAGFFPNDQKQVVTLASIIEKETGMADERSRVASVFLNRLRTGMKLQSDPTVIYAMTKGRGPLARPLLIKDIDETDSPYNTYRYAGLPPGPIANPGRASLQAVFKPAGTEDLYFVADGTGGHAFAKTLEEHNINVSRWRALQKDKK